MTQFIKAHISTGPLDGVTEVVFINTDTIDSIHEGIKCGTRIICTDGGFWEVKETPEELLQQLKGE